MAVPVLGVLFAKGARTKIRGAPQEIPVDAWITRQHGFSSAVTRAPVEDGSDVNDHVILQSRELTIEGLTSDHPVNLLATPAAVVGAVSEFLGQSGAETRSQSAAKALEKAWETKAELTIETRLRTYKNMVIEQLEWSESQTTSGALAFRMSLVEIRKVTLQSTPSSGLAAVASDLAESAVEAGRQPTAAAGSGAAGSGATSSTQSVTSLSQAAAMAG